MSEISTYVSSSPTVPVRPGSPGKAQAGRSIHILEDGQIGVHRSIPVSCCAIGVKNHQLLNGSPRATSPRSMRMAMCGHVAVPMT